MELTPAAPADLDGNHKLSYIRVRFGRFIGYSVVHIGNSLSAWNAVMQSGRFLGGNAESDLNVRYARVASMSKKIDYKIL